MKRNVRFFSSNFQDTVSLTCPCSILCLSLSVCLLINFCRCFLDTFFVLLHLLPMMTPIIRFTVSFARRTRFVITGSTGCAPVLAYSISWISTTSCQIFSLTPSHRCLVALVGMSFWTPLSGGVASALGSSSKILGMGMLSLVCRW